MNYSVANLHSLPYEEARYEVVRGLRLLGTDPRTYKSQEAALDALSTLWGLDNSALRAIDTIAARQIGSRLTQIIGDYCYIKNVMDGVTPIYTHHQQAHVDIFKALEARADAEIA